MKTEKLATFYNTQLEEVLYPPKGWYETEMEVLKKDDLILLNKKLEEFNHEVPEDDFLIGKTPEALPDNWAGED